MTLLRTGGDRLVHQAPEGLVASTEKLVLGGHVSVPQGVHPGVTLEIAIPRQDGA
jgi:hypothetical protein